MELTEEQSKKLKEFGPIIDKLLGNLQPKNEIWAYRFIKKLPEKKAQKERTEKLSLLAYKHGFNGDIGHFLQSRHIYLNDEIDWYHKSDEALRDIEAARWELGLVT